MSDELFGADEVGVGKVPPGRWSTGLKTFGSEAKRRGDLALEEVKGYRPQIAVIHEALSEAFKKPDAGYPRWSCREVIVLDWLVRAPSMLLPEEPKTIEDLEDLMGVQRGYAGRLARRNHYASALHEVARQIRKLHGPAVKMEVLAGALNRRTYNEEGEEVRKLSPKDQLAYIRTNLELDGEIGGRGQDLPSVQGAESWTLTRERQVLEVKNARPALEAAIVEEIGGPLAE